MVTCRCFCFRQGSLQNVKLVFNKEIKELMKSASCPSSNAPVYLFDGEQQFSAGKYCMLYFSTTASKPLAKRTGMQVVVNLRLLMIPFGQALCPLR